MTKSLLRRFAATIAATILGAGTAMAADCPPAPTPMAADEIAAGQGTARDRGFLWRVSRDGRTSWLYGTLHIGRRPWQVPGPVVRAAVREADVIALELDVLDPQMQRRFAARFAAAPKPPPLPDTLVTRMAAMATAQCVSATMLAPLRPELQLVALTALAGRRDGLDPAYGVDTMLAVHARGTRKPVLSLETPELQADALLLPPAAIAPMVDQGLTDLENGKTRGFLGRLADIWSDARLAELGRYEEWCECLDSDDARALHKRLLDARNPVLAERIDALHRDGKRVFAAVGALHMIGATALPSLLAERGYRVERVEFGR